MGLSYTVNDHIDFVADYYGKAIPIRNFNKAYNVSLVDENSKYSSVKEALGRKWGKNIKDDVVEQVIRDLQSARAKPNDPFSKALSTLQSNWVAATLNGNISVCIKQAASFPTAAYVLGPKPLMKAMAINHTSLKKIFNEIDTYTGTHYKRRLGLSTQELGDLAGSNNFIKRLTDKLDGAFVDKAQIPSGALPSNWIQSVDVWTTAKLWTASKFYVEDNLKISPTDENYWENVKDVYERVIEQTQPNYDIFHRPEIQKTTNAITRQVVMFTTQLFQNTGILYSSWGNLNAKNNSFKVAAENFQKNATEENKQKYEDSKKQYDKAKGEFGRAVGALTSSAVTLSIMNILSALMLHKVKKYRDEKDKKVSAKKIGEAFMWDMLSQVITTTVPIFGKLGTDVAGNIKSGYDFELPATSLVNDFIGAYAKVSKAIQAMNDTTSTETNSDKSKKLINATNELIKAAGKFAGIPVGNVENIVVSIKKYIGDIKDGGLFVSDEDEYNSKQIYGYKDLAAAIITGDPQKENKVKTYFSDCNNDIDKATITRYIKPKFQEYLLSSPNDAARLKKNLLENYYYKENVLEEWIYSALVNEMISDKQDNIKQIRKVMKSLGFEYSKDKEVKCIKTAYKDYLTSDIDKAIQMKSKITNVSDAYFEDWTYSVLVNSISSGKTIQADNIRKAMQSLGIRYSEEKEKNI